MTWIIYFQTKTPNLEHSGFMLTDLGVGDNEAYFTFLNIFWPSQTWWDNFVSLFRQQFKITSNHNLIKNLMMKLIVDVETESVIYKKFQETDEINWRMTITMSFSNFEVHLFHQSFNRMLRIVNVSCPGILLLLWTRASMIRSTPVTLTMKLL